MRYRRRFGFRRVRRSRRFGRRRRGFNLYARRIGRRM